MEKMEMSIDNTSLAYDSYYLGQFFSISKKSDSAIGNRKCREEFSYSRDLCKQSIKLSAVGFWWYKCPDAKRTARFISTIERRLKLSEKSKVLETNHKQAIVVELAPFWFSNEFRASVFTLFLRCAVVYYNGNLKKAMEEYELTSRCKNGISSFLCGFVDPAQPYLPLSEPSNGFVARTAYLDRDLIESSILVKPE